MRNCKNGYYNSMKTNNLIIFYRVQFSIPLHRKSIIGSRLSSLLPFLFFIRNKASFGGRRKQHLANPIQTVSDTKSPDL